MLALLCEKTDRLETNLADLRNSAANETKSTAGDKYETALAMLQAEQDNIRKQLQLLLEQKAVVESIDPSQAHAVIGPGSLVQSGGEYFFISTAAGKLNADGKIIFTLSDRSPLGAKLCGLVTGESAVINGRKYPVDLVL